ncbi:MAG: hypothetical protein AB3N15_06275 [Paracoccaceae bacterium]
MSDAPGIAILPYGTSLGPKLAQMPLSDLTWPLGCPDRLQGKCVGDLERTDHLIMYPKTSHHYVLRRGTKAQISLMMGEPSVIHAKHIKLLKWTWRRFFRVLSFHEALVDTIPNCVFFPYGTTWVPDWRDLEIKKTKNCSLIASAKRDTAGHQLRHEMVDWVRASDQDVEVLGRGYTPFDKKSDGLAPYRYSIVIENVREKNYFSEKLLDAVFCETVPIYWGCPNIGDFVDPEGLIICESANDIQRAVEGMSEEQYQSKLPLIRKMREQLIPYADIDLRAAEVIRQETALRS